jgi:serine protease Do
MKEILLLLILLPFFNIRAIAAPETLISRLDNTMDSIVTIKAIRVISVDNANTPIMTPNGPVVITNQRANFYEQTGAGVILDSEGTIVTNTHVIYGSQIIKVLLKNGTELNASISFISPSYDFSIIKVQTTSPLPAIEWADSDVLSLGQDIITVGHSELLNKTISGGVVTGRGSSPGEQGDTVELIRLNINHYPGDSGGPVFDKNGRFIALLNARQLNKDKACFAVPANKIHFAYLNLAQPHENH